jgi:hypothetical protein
MLIRALALYPLYGMGAYLDEHVVVYIARGFAESRSDVSQMIMSCDNSGAGTSIRRKSCARPMIKRLILSTVDREMSSASS